MEVIVNTQRTGSAFVFIEDPNRAWTRVYAQTVFRTAMQMPLHYATPFVACRGRIDQRGLGDRLAFRSRARDGSSTEGGRR